MLRHSFYIQVGVESAPQKPRDFENHCSVLKGFRVWISTTVNTKRLSSVPSQLFPPKQHKQCFKGLSVAYPGEFVLDEFVGLVLCADHLLISLSCSHLAEIICCQSDRWVILSCSPHTNGYILIFQFARRTPKQHRWEMAYRSFWCPAALPLIYEWTESGH